VPSRRTFSGIIGLHAWDLSDSDFMRNHEGANLRLSDDAHPTPILDTAAFALSRCAANAAAWATIGFSASGQNLGWWLYWAGHQ
jgi:hypothetical protein